MSIKLEQMIEVPGRYREIAVSKDKIVGSKITFGEADYFLDLLNSKGEMIKQFGKDYNKRKVPKKLLRKNLNPFYRGGDVTLFALLGYYMTFVPQLMYNLATLPFEKRELKKVKKSLDYLCSSLSIDCDDKKIYVLEHGMFPLGYTANLAIFDKDGNGIKKCLKLGDQQGDIAIHYLNNYAALRVYEDSLYILDLGLGIRIQEFDLDCNFKRVVFNNPSELPHRMNHYCDFAVGKNGFYLELSDNHGWTKVAKIDKIGRLEIFDLKNDLRLIDGIAVTDDYVFVIDSNNIFYRYTKDMKLISKEVIPELKYKGFESEFVRTGNHLVYFDGNLYKPIIKQKFNEPDECRIRTGKWTHYIAKLRV